MDSTEKLIEILILNILTYREKERLHQAGYFSYDQYYLDDNYNLKSKLEFQQHGRY